MSQDPKAARSAAVQMFDKNTKDYQATTGRDWRRGLDEYTLLPILDSLKLSGRTVLDVGSGTGRWALAALRRGAAVVHALEPSEKMVEAARQLEQKEREAAANAASGGKSVSYGLVHYLLRDVVDSDLSTLAVDVAVIGYVLHLLSSADQVLSALRNVYGALRSGGRLVGISFCIEADAPLEQHSPMPNHSMILPNGNVEWCTALVTFADPKVEATIFVQRWATLRRLMEEAGFQRVERIESRVDEAILSAMTKEEAASMLRYAGQCAFFSAEKK